MSRLSIVDLRARPSDEWRSRSHQFVRAGLAAGMPVRFLVPASCPERVLGSVPLERVLPEIGSLASTDDTSRLFDDALNIPPLVEGALRSAAVQRGDIVMVPEAGPWEVVGIARWLRSWTGLPPAVLTELGPAPVLAGREVGDLCRAVARQTRIPRPHRSLFVAHPADAPWYQEIGFESLIVGDLRASEPVALTDLLPPAPRPGEQTSGPAPIDPALVRAGMGLPTDAVIVAVWGPHGFQEALAALATVPWSCGLLCLGIGTGPGPTSGLPFTFGSLPDPGSEDQLKALAALADLHVAAGPDPSDRLVRTVMEQGRTILCDAGTAPAASLGPEQTIREGSLAAKLAGMLLRPHDLWRFGRRNRTTVEEPVCEFA